MLWDEEVIRSEVRWPCDGHVQIAAPCPPPRALFLGESALKMYIIRSRSYRQAPEEKVT